MAYSKIQIPGNGTNGPFVVAFALGYLSQSEVTCRVNQEVDGLGDPAYRTITWLDTELVNISGVAPTALDTITFERTVDKTTLKHDFSDGAPIIERNLDESHKQAIMLAHEALDGRFGALQSDLDAGNHNIINVLDPVDPQDAATKAYVDLQVISSGNVPAPTGGDVNKVLTATGVGTWAWGTPVVVPAATESTAGIAEIATDAEVTTGTDNTNKFLNVLKAVTAFARKAVSNTFTAVQAITANTGASLLSLNNTGAQPADLAGTRNNGVAGVANDSVFRILMSGMNDAGTPAVALYHYIEARIQSAVAGAQTGKLRIVAMIANVGTQVAEFCNGVTIGLPTGGFKGTGTINATGYYVNGNGAAGPSACYAFESTGDGGSSIATTWTTAALNVTRWNNLGAGNGALASNQVTLLAGRYRVRAMKQFYSTGGTTIIRLYNVTDGALIVNGPNNGLAVGGYDLCAEIPLHEFTIAGTKVIRIDYYVGAASATTGLGNNAGTPASHNNTYGYLYIERVE